MAVKNPRLSKKERERAAANGIGFRTLQNRVYGCGWDVEKAATWPVGKREKKEKPPKQVRERKYTDEQLQIALSNGISEGVLKNRIYLHGMPVEEAITRPKHANRGKGLRKKNYSTEFNRFLHG